MVDQLSKIDRPTLIVVGGLDRVTRVEAAEEIAKALPAQSARGCGSSRAPDTLPGGDAPDAFWPIVEEFIATV